ncbi:hypothetical protein AB0939_19405 [Streptomyces sp. NPDC006990]|uniref:hypothetical protein n=1 Tax=Streptomyces sp. NPDC006990 TaxID=3154481 RepID=UPI003451D297
MAQQAAERGGGAAADAGPEPGGPAAKTRREPGGASAVADRAGPGGVAAARTTPSGAAPGAGPPGVPGAVRLRAWTVGWSSGLAQALGAAVLLVTECVRQDVAPFGVARVPDGARLPGYAADFPRMADALDAQWWFRAAEAARDAFGFGEPRAALWAAVCAALVVRLNVDGPPRTQCFLSLAGACYCLVAGLSTLPYLALAGAALPFALLAGGLAVVLATAAPRVRSRAG